MSLPKEVAEKLRAIAQANRGTLLKDISPTDLMVLTDSARDAGLIPEDIHTNKVYWGYLLYASKEQLGALKQAIPSMSYLRYSHVGGGEGAYVRKTIFPYDTLLHIIKALNLPPRKYLRNTNKMWPWKRGATVQ